MTQKDQDSIEVDLHVANDDQTGEASNEGETNQLSLTVKLIPIVRLLAKQAARDLYQAAKDDSDTDQDIPGG